MIVRFPGKSLVTPGRYLALIGVGAMLLGPVVHSHHHFGTSGNGEPVRQTAHSCHCCPASERDGGPQSDGSGEPSDTPKCHVCQVLGQVSQGPAVVELPVRRDVVFEVSLPSSDDAVDGVLFSVRQRGPPIAA